MDSDGDGTLTREEVKAGYNDHFGQSMSDEEIEKIFSSVDSDLSGEIDYTEFVAATMNQRTLASQKRLESAFKAFDKDGNGQISPQEVRLLLGGGGTLDDKTVAKIIAQVDADGDGQVSFSEFCEMMSKNII
jgi:calcium-dependent protein kinase